MTADNKLNLKEIIDSDIVDVFFSFFLEFSPPNFTLSWSKKQSTKRAQLELVNNRVSDSLSCCRTESNRFYALFHLRSAPDTAHAKV